jgi:hypothetical protein
VDIPHICCSGLGGLKKKLAGRFKSKRCRADDADYNPATDSEAQSSAGGSISMDTEDAPHAHLDYPIDVTGWTYPREDSLWLSTAPGGQLISMICPLTQTFSFFILSFSLMSSGNPNGHKLSQASSY